MDLAADILTARRGEARQASIDIINHESEPLRIETFGTLDDVIVCSTGNPLILQRKSGKPVTINASDKGGALFQLPIDVSTTWTAYARALSKPNTYGQSARHLSRRDPRVPRRSRSN